MNPKMVPFVMSTQIAVRLPSEVVEFIDSLVDQGAVKSRAAFIATAIARERRHRAAEADVEILLRLGNDPDLDALTAYQTARPLELD